MYVEEDDKNEGEFPLRNSASKQEPSFLIYHSLQLLKVFQWTKHPTKVFWRLWKDGAALHCLHKSERSNSFPSCATPTSLKQRLHPRKKQCILPCYFTIRTQTFFLWSKHPGISIPNHWIWFTSFNHFSPSPCKVLLAAKNPFQWQHRKQDVETPQTRKEHLWIATQSSHDTEKWVCISPCVGLHFLGPPHGGQHHPSPDLMPKVFAIRYGDICLFRAAKWHFKSLFRVITEKSRDTEENSSFGSSFK